MSDYTPYHDGERAVQDRTGQRSIADGNGRVISDRIPRGAQKFVHKQRTAILGTRDDDRNLWATMIVGPEGFVSTNDALNEVRFAVTKSESASLPCMNAGDDIGMLLIELSSRRRLRVNGTVTKSERVSVTVSIFEAYPNCPKYIQQRLVENGDTAIMDSKVQRGSELGPELIARIRRADTFFVASADVRGRIDASHRGGNPGFVQINNGVLRIPDYPGNSMFNTLGNFTANPIAGLSFPDFAGNRQLRLTGDVSIDYDAANTEHETGGTQRWWEFRPRAWVVSPLNQGLAWGAPEPSRYNP